MAGAGSAMSSVTLVVWLLCRRPLLGKQWYSQEELWENSSLGLGTTFQLQPSCCILPELWCSCTHPHSYPLLTPPLPPWLGPRGVLSPLPSPAWLCWSPLGVGRWGCWQRSLPQVAPLLPTPATLCPDSRYLGLIEARQNYVKTQ